MQHQALPGIFVHQGQPLERTAVGRPVVDEVTGPHVVLEPGGLRDATIDTHPRLRAEFLGFSQPQRPPQPQLVPEPSHALEVHRPASADQHRVDPPVAVPRVPPRQPFDLPGQRRLAGPRRPTVSQGRARPSHDAANPALGDAVVLAQVIRRGPLLVGTHHFFSTAVYLRVARANNSIERNISGSVAGGGRLLPCAPIRWTFARGSRRRSIITTARSAGSPGSSASAPPSSSACSSAAVPPGRSPPSRTEADRPRPSGPPTGGG